MKNEKEKIKAAQEVIDYITNWNEEGIGICALDVLAVVAYGKLCAATLFYDTGTERYQLQYIENYTKELNEAVKILKDHKAIQDSIRAKN